MKAEVTCMPRETGRQLAHHFFADPDHDVQLPLFLLRCSPLYASRTAHRYISFASLLSTACA